MATLREYFDIDFNKYMSVHNTWEMRNESGATLHSVIAKISQVFDANAKFWSFFLPQDVDIHNAVPALLNLPLLKDCILTPEGDEFNIKMGFSNYSELASSETLKFTGRVFLYIDQHLSEILRAEITKTGLNSGYQFLIRDREYSLKRSELEKPMAFISHDSRDKDSLVRELAAELSKLMCPVWYDEYSLSVGDSLRSSIEKGLKETRKCIVVLSPNFISNEGWGKAEFDSIYTREILEKNNIVLPVWHNVDVNSVYEYSPRMADRVGLSSSLGIEQLAAKLAHVIKST